MENNAIKTVLILGGRGRFGLSAARAFASAGWRVLAQIRPGAAAPNEGGGIHWLPLAPDDTAALVRAARGASVVIHALNPLYTQWDRLVLPLLDASLCAARQLGATLMLPGNVYNFGAAMPALLHEATPQLPSTAKGHIRVRMEQLLAREAAAGGVRSVVIRAGDFFGSGTGNWFDQALVKDLTRGKMVYPGRLDVPTPWAYLPDLARAFARVADKLTDASAVMAPFEVFHFEGHTLTGKEWADQFADAAWDNGWLQPGGSLKTRFLPWPLIQAGGLLVPMWRELARMRYLWQTPHALSGNKLAALIGPEPHTELPLAVQQSLQALGKVRHTGCSAAAWA